MAERAYTSRSFGGGKTYTETIRVQDSSLNFRPLEFIHKTNAVDEAMERYPEGTAPGTEFLEYYARKTVHWRNKQPHPCMSFRSMRSGVTLGDCKMCKEAEVWKGSKEQESQQTYRNLSNTTTFVMHVVVFERAAGSTKLVPTRIDALELPYGAFTTFDNLVRSLMEQGKEVFGAKGRNFTITHNKNFPPAKRYTIDKMDSEDCPDIGAWLSKQTELTDLLNFKEFVPVQFHPLLGQSGAPKTVTTPAPTETSAAPTVKVPKTKKAKAWKPKFKDGELVLVDVENKIYGTVTEVPVDVEGVYTVTVYTEVHEDGTVKNTEVREFVEAELFPAPEEE